MAEKYLCIGYGISKKGKEYSRLVKIIEYIDRETNTPSAFIDLKQTKFSEQIFDVGEIKNVTTEIF